MSASDLVKQWREKAAQKAAERAAQSPVMDVNFDGFVGKARRVELTTYAQAGKMPQFLATAMFAAAQGQNTEFNEETATPEQKSELLRFQSIIFCAMMVEPKFSREEDRVREGRPLEEDELDYSEFMLMAPEAVNAGVQWQVNGCPGMPISTETGVMSLEELTTFRDSGAWLTSPESFYHSEGEFWDTKPSARTI